MIEFWFPPTYSFRQNLMNQPYVFVVLQYTEYTFFLKVTRSVDCNTPHIITALDSTLCRTQYVGERENLMSERFMDANRTLFTNEIDRRQIA